MLVTWSVAGYSQVVYTSALKQDHKGEIDKSVNYPGKKLYWSMKYVSTQTLKFRTYSCDRDSFTLMIADNPAMNNAIRLPMMIRDVQSGTYFEIYMNNGTETKTFTVIYENYEKWYRIKFAPQWGCRRAATWQRVNDVPDFESLIGSVVGQMDTNLKLDCYKVAGKAMAKK